MRFTLAEELINEVQGNEKRNENRRTKNLLISKIRGTPIEDEMDISKGFTVHHLTPHEKGSDLLFISNEEGVVVADAIHRVLEAMNKFQLSYSKLLTIPILKEEEDGIKVYKFKDFLK